MKKIVLAALLLVGLTASAQTGHLTVKGVPIDGTLNEMVGKLKQKGFTHMVTNQGTAILKGEFASFKECTVGVVQHESGIVNRVLVMLPERDTWSVLYSDYSRLKDMLTQKYGEPAGVTEEWQGNSQPDDDHDRMYYVRFDKCKYNCDWVTDEGAIELRISHNGVSSTFVSLLYVDTQNEAKVQSGAIDDL